MPVMFLKRRYLPPKSAIDEAIFKELICTSPVTGGSEDTGEEDWVI